MRPLSLILSTSLLLLASTASAQTQQYPSTEPEAMSRVDVMAQAKPYKFWEYEAEAISGGYEMSNGWRLKVEPSSDGIVAKIDKQRPMNLIAQSRDRFISPDGNVWMEFNRGKYGDEMVLSYVPSPATERALGSRAVVVTATLAQR